MENIHKMCLRDKICFFGEVTLFSVRSRHNASARRTHPRHPFSKRIAKVQFHQVPECSYFFRKPGSWKICSVYGSWGRWPELKILLRSVVICCPSISQNECNICKNTFFKNKLPDLLYVHKTLISSKYGCEYVRF